MLAALLIAASATVANAEIEKLGGFKLGDKVKARATPAKVYGCGGTVTPDVDGKQRVVLVRFRSKRCNPDALARAIARETKAQPVVNPSGDRVWEGAKATVIVSTSLATKVSPVVLLVPPVKSGTRVCWAGDGFDVWWSAFKTALAAGKPEALAGAFAYPVKDAQGAVKIARAADLAEAWAQVDPEDVAKVRNGGIEPTCKIDEAQYELSLGDSYIRMTARRVNGAWRWTVFDPYAPG